MILRVIRSITYALIIPSLVLVSSGLGFATPLVASPVADPSWVMAASISSGRAINASLTRYLSAFGLLLEVDTEANTQFVARDSYTMSGLYARVTANSVTATTTVVSRVNSANGTQVISIPSGTSGTFQDTTHSDNIVDGDAFNSMVVTGAAGTSLTFTTVSYKMSTASNNTPIIGSSLNVSSTTGGANAGETKYIPLGGFLATATAEDDTSYMWQTSATLSNLRVYVVLNTLDAGSTTVRLRKNGGNGTATLTIPFGATGAFENTTATDSIVNTDNVNLMIVASGASGEIRITVASVKVDSLVRPLTTQNPFPMDAVSGTTYYSGIEGSTGHFATTEANAQTIGQTNYTAKNLFTKIQENSVNGTSTITFRKNNGAGTLTVSIPDSTSGVFTDTTHNDAVVATDNIDYEVVSGGNNANFMHITAIGVEIEQGVSISASPTSKNFGTVNTNSTYWSNGSSPAFGGGGTTTQNATANSGTEAWTNAANAYASDNATASAVNAVLNHSPTANTNGTLPWTNPDRAYGSNNQYATVSPTYGATTTKQPTANTNGSLPWTDPANAYGNTEDAYATATPSSTTTGNNYPTSDDSNTGGFTVTPNLWQKVDDTSNVDYITGVTNAGGRCTFGFTAFAIPANAYNISLSIVYSENAGATTAKHAASLKVGGTYYDDLGLAASTNGFVEQTYSTSTNPKSGVAWTPDDINGSGANGLTNFGVSSTDFNPDVQFGYVYAKVTYYLPQDQIYKTYGITDPGTSSTITKVEIGYEAFATATQKLDFYTSANGGGAWSSVHTSNNLPTADPGASITYIDVTADQTWTWTLLNDTNFQTKIITHWITGTPTWSVDELYVRVTYDDRRPYDQIWGTFGVTGTNTITTVEVGYEAFATATGRFKIYTSNDGGSTWSSVHTTANLGTSDPNIETWVDATSDFGWTWTTLNDSNLKVKVVTDYVSGTPAWSLDWISVRVTTPTKVSVYKTYGFSLTGSVTKVEAGFEGYASVASQNVSVSVSWDNGSSWATAQKIALASSDNDSVTWLDFTSATTWNTTKINDTNFQVRITYDAADATTIEYADYVPARVTTSGSVQDAECYFTLTNDSTGSVNITMQSTNFNGGTGWALTSGSPGLDQARLTIFRSGDNSSQGTILTTSSQDFKSGIGASTSIKFEIKFETGTFSDGLSHSSNTTFTAILQ